MKNVYNILLALSVIMCVWWVFRLRPEGQNAVVFVLLTGVLLLILIKRLADKKGGN